MNDRFPTRFLLCVAVLAAVILFEYGESFNFYFVGDDFSFIEVALAEKVRILWKSSSYYHYYPLGILINSLPACFGWFDPRAFAAINFAFYLSCSILVMRMYERLAGGVMGGFLAALIYSTAAPNSEVIYWKTGTQTIAMALFSLLSVLFFIRYTRGRAKANLAGCVAAFALSMLCIEQGIVTFGVLLLCDLTFFSAPRWRAEKENRRHIAKQFMFRQFLFISVPVSLTLLKAGLGFELSPFALGSIPLWAMPRLALETAARLIDFNRVILPLRASHNALWLVSLSGVVFFSVYIAIRKSPAGLFFLLSGFGTLLTISLVAGGPNSRYFCLPLAFHACLLSLVIGDLSRVISRKLSGTHLQGRAQWLAALLSISACAAIAYAGLRGNLIRRDYWKSASKIQSNIVRAVENLYLSGAVPAGKGSKLYLLDIPEHIWSERYSIFYVSSNSLMPDLRHRLGEAAGSVELIASGVLFEMTVRGERVTYRVLGRRNMVNRRDIEGLIGAGHHVLRFSPRLMTLVPLS